MTVKIYLKTRRDEPIIIEIKEPITRILNDAQNVSVTGADLENVAVLPD